ncbi:MAG: MFS transporter [Flavobacteriia bacterium]
MSKKHDPFAALRVKEFNFYLLFRFFLTLGIQMQSVIVGWQIYALTDDVLFLGMIGLAEAIPFILISFLSGHIADTFNRKRIVVFCTFLFIILTGFLLWLSDQSNAKVFLEYGTYPVFMTIAGVGVIRGFLSAAIPSFMAQIVQRELYANAATWNSTVWHVASILGPSLAGFMIAASYTSAYTMDLSFILIALISFMLIKNKPMPAKEKMESLFESIAAGIRFVFKDQLILGALSLDLFAVLFGGAVALLPAFADEVLHAGAIELGFLRAAPALGAVIMALLIAYKPPTHNAGRNLFLSVGAFGVSTILFGLSTNFFWAFFFLFLTGAFDNVSVVIRHTILQLSTPNNMRGRVSAVNGIFIGSSNEIGAFESGVTARAFGLKPAIIIGGILTVLVVIATARMAPKLRKLNIDKL